MTISISGAGALVVARMISVDLLVRYWMALVVGKRKMIDRQRFSKKLAIRSDRSRFGFIEGGMRDGLGVVFFVQRNFDKRLFQFIGFRKMTIY